MGSWKYFVFTGSSNIQKEIPLPREKQGLGGRAGQARVSHS